MAGGPMRKPRLGAYVLREGDGTNGRAQAHHPLVCVNCGDQLVKGTHKKPRRKQKTPNSGTAGVCASKTGKANSLAAKR